jgi:hypothetical protein
MPSVAEPVLASELMKIRATFLGFVKIGTAVVLASCGGSRGHVVVDTPVLPYQAPDISEITGIDEDSGDSDSDATAAGSGSAQAAPQPQK